MQNCFFLQSFYLTFILTRQQKGLPLTTLAKARNNNRKLLTRQFIYTESTKGVLAENTKTDMILVNHTVFGWKILQPLSQI